MKFFPLNRQQTSRPSSPRRAVNCRQRRLFEIGARLQRRGAAVVEFAIVAPVFFLMVIGIIEVGRALMVEQVLVNASRVGARQASTTGATTAQVEATVQAYTNGVSVKGVTVTVSPDPSAAVAGTAITVNTTIPFSSVTWIKAPWFMGGKTLRASSQMRKEGYD